MFSGTLDMTKLNDGDHRTYSAYTQRKVDQVLAYEPALTQQYLCNIDTDIPLLTYDPTPIRALEITEKEILKTKLFAMLTALMPPREYTMIQDFIREILDTIRIKSIYIQNLIELIVNIAVAHINTKRK